MTVGVKFNISPPQKRILIAPLDWGLGHATRCVPLIHSLTANGCEVVIAASGKIAALLQQEFPHLTIIPLKGYQISYTRRKFWLPLHLLTQLPRLLRTVYQEHQWLKKTVQQYKIDAVISDNRLGLYHKTLPCVYITHQLAIQTGTRFFNWLAQKMHYRFINRYKTCWVPDAAQTPHLAGILSHPKRLPQVPVQYLGPLSRMEKKQAPTLLYDVVLLLSGPEPQRSILEKILLQQLAHHPCKALLVRGLPGHDQALPPLPDHVQAVNHLSAAALAQVLQQGDWVICRSGYTTVMDLVQLGQKAILVPTPGQTEQEYLGSYLQQQGLFYSVPQQLFNLLTDLKKAKSYSPIGLAPETNTHQKILTDWVEQIGAASGGVS